MVRFGSFSGLQRPLLWRETLAGRVVGAMANRAHAADQHYHVAVLPVMSVTHLTDGRVRG